MRRVAPWVACVCVGLISASAVADDGMALLQRSAQSSRQLTYSGTFVYRRGSHEETSRIAHTQVAGREFERIEVLDGSPREIVRSEGEIKCFLPDKKLLIVETRARRPGFPNLLPVGLSGLADHYQIQMGVRERIAGLQSVPVRLEPRDDLRYGHQFWLDAASGLLLKAAMRGAGGELLESFTFTQINVGGPLDPSALVPGYGRDQIRVQKARATDVKAEHLGWNFREMLPGFQRIAALKRWASADGTGSPEGLHVVFSDGLASLSVFIEVSGAADEPDGLSSVGAINIYRRRAAGHQLLVMGEVPVGAVKRVGDGIERRIK